MGINYNNVQKKKIYELQLTEIVQMLPNNIVEMVVYNFRFTPILIIY